MRAPSEFGGLCDFKVVTRFVRVALGIRMCTSLREDAHKISSDICPWGRARRLGAGDVSPRRAACAFQKRVQSRAHARPNALPHDPRPSPGHHQTATHDDEAEATNYLVISPRETPGQTPSLGAYSSSCDAYHDPFVWACPFVIADLPRGNTHTGGTKATPVRAQPQPSAGCTQSALATAAASVPLAAARRGSLVIVSPRPVHVRQASLAKAQRGGAVPVDTSWRGLLACSSAMLGHAAQPCGESCRHLPVLHGGPARLRITWR